MFEILKKETFAAETYLMDIYSPRLADSALPGQFLIVKTNENSERIPLTISDYNTDGIVVNGKISSVEFEEV